MAVVNLETKQISGCKEGTIQWYHEEGHIKFNELEEADTINYRKEFLLKACIILLVFNQLFNNYTAKVFTFCCASLSLFYYFYEEVWCWKYAFQKTRNH